MVNYDGEIMVIRETNRGRYQVLPGDYTEGDMTRAPVFDTRAQAEAWIARPIPIWLVTERALCAEREKYLLSYSNILADPDLRQMRREIQGLYADAAWQSKLAGDAQRAAVRGMGQISCMGRDVGDVRQGRADEYGDDAARAWAAHSMASAKYEDELQRRLIETGIPVGLFRAAIAKTEPRPEGVGE